MKADKLRGLEPAELERQSQDAQEQLFRLRFQMGMGQFEGLKKYRTLKKDRARMLTLLTEKAKAEAAGVAAPVAKATKTVATKKVAKEKKAK